MKMRISLSLLVLMALLRPVMAFAQAAPPVTLSVAAGIDGYYRIGRWLPIRVIVENSGPEINGRVEVTAPRANGSAIYSYPLNLPTQSRKEISLPYFPESYLNHLSVALIDDHGQEIVSQDQSLRSLDEVDRLDGVIADSPSAFNSLAQAGSAGGRAHVAQLTPGTLPDYAAALDALDTLIVSNVDTGAFTDAQRAALAAWIADGGQLLVAGGSGWQKTSAGLRDLLPLQPDNSVTLDDLTALQTFARSLDSPGSGVIATGALLPEARVILKQANTPLIVSKLHGSGAVTFLAFDPADFRQWDALPKVYDTLVETRFDRPGWSYGVQDANSALSAASNIPNLNLPPVTFVCGFLLIYMIAIGPLNYFIVRRLHRRELAWITVPLLAVGFVGTAFLAGTVMHGNRPVLNRLALVQVWPASGQARVTGIVGLYAPRRDTYQVQAEPGLLFHPLSPNNPYQPSSNTSDWVISGGVDAQRASVQMDVSEVKMLNTDSTIAAPPIVPEVRLVVDRAGARVVGKVTNNSNLTLQKAVLLGPGQALELGTLQPGDSIPVDVRLERAARATQGPSKLPYYYGSADTTLEDIAGQSPYNDIDNERVRRTDLLHALLGYNTSIKHEGRGSGLYLAGWSNVSPLDIQIPDGAFQAYDTTLYIVDLSPALSVASGPLTLPPGLFTWQVDNADNTSVDPINPYNTTVFPGDHILQFNLARPIKYETVKDLMFYLGGNAGNGSNYSLSVWDYRANDWLRLPNVGFGENHLANPEQHVGPGGQIRLKISVAPGAPLQIDRADFTLTVQ